jgi:hypothetical protein
MLGIHIVLFVGRRSGRDVETIVRRAERYVAMAIGMTFGISGLYLARRGAVAVGLALILPGAAVAFWSVRRLADDTRRERAARQLPRC